MIYFHASHEQFSPRLLLQLVVQAEKAGFKGVLSSDHFKPWSESQTQSGFAWSWIGAAMQSTNLPFGIVSAPSYRYHPAVIAQASATLAEMFPDRFWLSLGSGEYFNEAFTAIAWPIKEVRNQRLKESADIIRRLWAGETVTAHGLVKTEEAHLYTRPEKPPLLLGAAMTVETAKWLGSWADGLLTVARSPDTFQQMATAFKQNGGHGKPIHLKVQVSCDQTEEDAVKSAYQQWKYTILGSAVNSTLRTPKMFDEATQFVRPEDVCKQVFTSQDAEEHVQLLQSFRNAGADLISVHNVNLNQRYFIKFYKEQVLPKLKDR